MRHARSVVADALDFCVDNEFDNEHEFRVAPPFVVGDVERPASE